MKRYTILSRTQSMWKSNDSSSRNENTFFSGPRRFLWKPYWFRRRAKKIRRAHCRLCRADVLKRCFDSLDSSSSSACLRGRIERTRRPRAFYWFFHRLACVHAAYGFNRGRNAFEEKTVLKIAPPHARESQTGRTIRRRVKVYFFLLRPVG